MTRFVVVLFGLFWSASFAQSALGSCQLEGAWSLNPNSLALMLQQKLDPEETLWFASAVGEFTLELSELERTADSATLAATYSVVDLDHEYGHIAERVMTEENAVKLVLNGVRGGYLYTFHTDGSLDIAYAPAEDTADTLEAVTNVGDAPDLLAEVEWFGAPALDATFLCPDENTLNIFPELVEPMFAEARIGQLPFRRIE